MESNFREIGRSSCPWAEGIVYERFLLVTPSSNMDQHADEFFEWLFQLQAQHYDDWFGYISHRLNRNAGIPLHIVKAKSLIPLWRTYALVSYSEFTTKLFHSERTTLTGKEHEIFHSLPEAMVWTDRRIREIRESEGPAPASFN